MARAKLYYRPLGEDPNLNKVLSDLRKEGVDLRRGDIVLDSIERGLPRDPNDPHTDQGYRHDGIYIFDGTEIVPLEWDGPDPYGTIPEELQVVDFSPMYWSHVLNNNALIPFDVRRHLGLLNPKYVSQITGSHLVYSFINQNGRLYGIVDFDVKDPSPDRVKEFLREIQDQKYFEFYSKWIHPEDPLSLPRGVSYEQLLFHRRPR